MSEESDYMVIRRLVRRALVKSLGLSIESARIAALACDQELRKECGGTKLYVPIEDDLSITARNDRIRRDYHELMQLHGSRIALGILERRESISERQLYRICVQPRACRVGDDHNHPGGVQKANARGQGKP